MLFRQIFDEQLAQYAYLVGCQRTGEAIVIDPERDIDRYLQVAAAENLTITAVTETHIHADFLSGAREFAERGVRVYLSNEGGPDWTYGWAAGYDVVLLKHRDAFAVGHIDFTALHTPGHTPEHLSFLLTDRGAGADEPMGIVSGDFVFVGDLGRPDLLESAAGHVGDMEPSARRLFATTEDFLLLPDYLQVWPGHGAGSACGKALGAVPETTVGYERRFSPALRKVGEGEQSFVEFILEGQPEPPRYFADMKRLNRDGAPVLGTLPVPPEISPASLPDLAAGGAVIVDTRRDRRAFFAGHVPGALYAPYIKSFPTIAGSYIRPDEPVVLIIERADLDGAVRALVRVGLDHVQGYVTPEAFDAYAATGAELAGLESIDLDELRRRASGGDYHVLDVRKVTEFVEGHVPGAQNIAHTQLAGRLDEVPRERPIVVHCRTGQRAAAACALLQREGYQVVHVDDVFDVGG
jgi:hydroxyacylglutathione hydrolase